MESTGRNCSTDNLAKRAWLIPGCELEYALHDCYKSSPNVMAQIFISYRRLDSGYLASALSDKLQEHFGPNSVFFDIDNIPLGVDFREYIGNAVGQCDVLLVIIGDQWMGPVDGQGKRRIDDPSDYVRIEIESALKRNIPVIPVLVEEATMPSAANLPPSIESMAFRNAAEIRAGRDLRQHIEQLIRGLETIMKTSSPARRTTTDEGSSRPEVKIETVEEPIPARGEPTRLRDSVEATRAKTAKKGGDSSLLEEIQKALSDFTDSHVYIGKSMLFFDNTVFGGAKDGLLLTGDAVYWHNIAGKSGQTSYTDILSVDFRESQSMFTSAKILINQEEIEVNVADQGNASPYLAVVNGVGRALANVIRQLTEHLKR